MVLLDNETESLPKFISAQTLLEDKFILEFSNNDKNIKKTRKKRTESLKFLLSTKKWNPYCIRHSSITADSDYLPEYALKKKVR